jgi:hypothetical protein
VGRRDGTKRFDVADVYAVRSHGSESARHKAWCPWLGTQNVFNDGSVHSGTSVTAPQRLHVTVMWPGR